MTISRTGPVGPGATPSRRAATPALAALHAMAANVVAVGARGRDTRCLGPFMAFLAPERDDQFMSFAVPRAGAADWAEPIAALRRLFTEAERTLRLEFFNELYPTLGAALEAAGIERRTTQSAMAVTSAALRPRRLAQSAAFRLIEPEDIEGFDGLLEIQQVCFGVSSAQEATELWRRHLRAGVAEGSVLAALSTVEGRPACCACLLVGGGAAELSGVATRPGYRRRGLASGLCSRLLASHFAQGHRLAWLSAGDAIAETVYRRMGFRTVGFQFNHGLPPSSQE